MGESMSTATAKGKGKKVAASATTHRGPGKKIITVYCDAAEHELVRRRAEELGLPVNRYLFILARNDMNLGGPLPITVNKSHN
jgi:hypothetical protein